MVPTRRFWLLVALGIPVAMAAGSLNVPLVALGYDVLLVLAAWATTRFAPSGSDLRFRRNFDHALSVRVPNKITLTLLNDGVEPVSMLLRDEPPPTFLTQKNERRVALKPGSEKEIVYETTPLERGSEYFRGTYLRIDCPLGLAYREVKLPSEQPIRVYPNILALQEFDLLRQRGRLQNLGIRRTRMRGIGTEFESLREYTEGDDYRKIDWKASARRGKYVVRQYEQERNQVVIICIDVGRHMLAEVDGVRKLDRALDACLMLTHAAVISGDLVGLLVYSDTVLRYIPPKKGRSQMRIVIDAIHDLVAEPVEPDHMAAMTYLATHWKRRALMVAFTDIAGPDSARQMVGALGPLARRHLTLLARVSDPRLNVLFDQEIENERSLYERAASDLVLAERREATMILNTAGIFNLEAEPDDLSAALVNYYFVVKERSLL